MSANTIVVTLTLEKCIKISKWKVKEGTIVSAGRLLLLYDAKPGSGKPEIQKLKATAVGTVRKLLAKEGDVVQPGKPLLELEKCTHPTVMKDMCAECGADLRNEDGVNENVASIPMVHSIPELKVNAEQAQILGKADEQRLLANQKLVLLVDLDQTLIHTTNDNIPPNLKDVYHFRLHGSLSPWHHTRLRPGTKEFLKEMSQYYELHICTFGSRMYAHKIAEFLDPDGQYFSHRILSRDECVSANSKTANLKALFPCGDEMVCIIDDREDVWNFASNLIHVKPYHFFQHTGDINAPPGLSKQENDDKGEYDFSRLGDGMIKKDIMRPNTSPGPSQESQKDAIDLVKRKGDGTCPEQEISVSGAEVNEKNELSVEKTVTKVDEEDEFPAENIVTDVSEKNELSVDKITTEDGDENGPVVGNTANPSQQTAETIKGDDVAHTGEEVQENQSESKEDQDKDTVVPENPCGTCDVTEDPEREDSKSSDNSKLVVEKSQASVLENQENSTELVPKTHLKDGSDTLAEEYIEQRPNSQPNDPDQKSSETLDKLEDALTKSKAEEIEVADHDDYLLYLEEILKRIHKEFYHRMAEGLKPDMKSIIPAVRKKVLENTNLVFSGLVPNNIPLEKSRAYQVAVSLGAKVTQDLNKNTTHLVAVRPGTAKVNSARRMKNVFMVTADWLWVSAERWERVDEKVFPLGRNRAGTRHPPPHCGSPEHTPGARENQPQPTTSTGRSRTASGRFMDTINPLLSFSLADIADMDQEVNDIFDESESDGDEDKANKKKKKSAVPERDSDSEEDSQSASLTPAKQKIDDDSDTSSSSADSLSGEHPHGWAKHNLKRKRPDCKLGTGTATESDGDEETEDMPSTKFRRGEALPSDLDLGENDSDSPGSEGPPDPDEMDDGEWNMMGAALEREFLS